jgi:hypothetical protein
MRTTVTLDDDVAMALDHIQSEQRATFRQVLNDLLREGLAARAHRAQHDTVPAKKTRARALAPRIANFDQTSDVIALIEGETYR